MRFPIIFFLKPKNQKKKKLVDQMTRDKLVSFFSIYGKLVTRNLVSRQRQSKVYYKTTVMSYSLALNCTGTQNSPPPPNPRRQ
jgi:hypothetical protein